MDDDDQQSLDDALEEERRAHDPNEDVLDHLPKLPQDYDTPAASQNDPYTPNLPPDHPAKDSRLDPDEVYESDEDDASDVWDETESNDREEDALNDDIN